MNFDANNNLYALVKLVGYTVNPADLKVNMSQAMKLMPVESFWMKAPNTRATSPTSGKIVYVSTPGSKIYFSDFEAVTELFSSALTDSAIQFGYRTKGAADESIHFGTIERSDEKKAQVLQRFKEIEAKAHKVLPKEK